MLIYTLRRLKDGEKHPVVIYSFPFENDQQASRALAEYCESLSDEHWIDGGSVVRYTAPCDDPDCQSETIMEKGSLAFAHDCYAYEMVKEEESQAVSRIRDIIWEARQEVHQWAGRFLGKVIPVLTLDKFPAEIRFPEPHALLGSWNSIDAVQWDKQSGEPEFIVGGETIYMEDLALEDIVAVCVKIAKQFGIEEHLK